MKTEYYCKNCGTLFEEEGKQPNLNKLHSCGCRADLLRCDESPEKTEKN